MEEVDSSTTSLVIANSTLMTSPTPLFKISSCSVGNDALPADSSWEGERMECADLGVRRSTIALDDRCSSQEPCPTNNTVILSPASPGVVAQFSGAIAGVGAAVSTISAAAGSLAAFDAQALASLGLSSCVPELAASTSPSRFVVSPFYDLGPFGMVFGNAGLMVLVGGVHLSAVVLRSHPTPKTSPHVKSEAAVNLRFPHYSMTVAMFLLPGVSFGCAALLFLGDVGGTIGGLCALGVLASALWVRLKLIGQHRIVRRLSFAPYTRGELAQAVMSLGATFSKLPPWAVPSGRWLPQSCAATHGRARSAIIGGQEWLSEYAVVYTVAMNFVSGLPLSATECGVVFGAACIIPLTGLVAMIWRRPCRVPLLTWLNVLQYLFTFVTTLLISFTWASVNGVDGGALPSLTLGLSCVTC